MLCLSNDTGVIDGSIHDTRGTTLSSPVDTLYKTNAATVGLSARFGDLAACFDEVHNAPEGTKDTGDLS